ncbi:MAG: hypothetical protein M3063_06030, partial [Actinomycetota bacterium]|nr:hypothetical protein [Actinomycetota bacterium]
MIVCTRCGFENEDTDSFCGSCASFLEWSGQKVKAEEPEPEPEVEPEPEPEAHTGLVGRVKDRIGLGDTRSADDTPPAGSPVTTAASTSPVEEAPGAAPAPWVPPAPLPSSTPLPVPSGPPSHPGAPDGEGAP